MDTKSQNKIENNETKRRRISGVIVSDKMKDTAVVSVQRLVKHPKYGKFMKINKRFKAHNALNEYKMNDVVIIEECRPLSKDKHWKIISKK